MVRLVRRRPDGETVSLAPIIVAVVLVVLAALGTWGVVAVKGGRSSSSDRSIPPKNYAALPPMTFTLGGSDARMVDVRVLLEIDPTVDPKQASSFVPRIADQMADRMRQIDPEQLSGAEGAKLMKSALTSVVDREARSMRVREVLLERMVVR
ncbi:flagellar basal body-associated FliL family protein [Azospirillum rugosum]|uniref:Flagellar protein FliL n=1 Tax=Azospirillum rugosum TaxID=416170 RepID=A0ABS4SLN0_9PROT|nr:flagellar basal body-associated FliL family protein [Azospirillum rugosum]MBP2293454.1 flagellar basal body-associated protein FliL [Azospirillum rugosum]MDQ0530225.1 flagellar basal body-associated protein FliL [Azospirillum rugosum]